jgi:hypothetical protein
MAIRTDIKEELIAIEVIAGRSRLGKFMAEMILRPILKRVEAESRRILDDLGFMVVSEIQHRLATAPSGKTYKVYMIDEGATGKGRYTLIGYYTASATGGPPASGTQVDGSGLPTGSLYESIWYGVDDEGFLTVSIDSPQGTEKDYFFIPGKGVVVGGTKTKTGGKALEVGEYFKILNDPVDGTRPDWWGSIIRRKEKYWKNWMQNRMAEAISSTVKSSMVRRVLKVNIYWESN